MRKKLLTITFLLIFAITGIYAQGTKNIVRAYGISTKKAGGYTTQGTICFYNYAANGPGLISYYYYNYATKAKATASFTYTGYTSAPPDFVNLKANEQVLVQRQDMKIIMELLDKNNIPHPAGAGMTPINAHDAANELEDVADAAAATDH
jgi:hypothetical protein